MLRSLYLGRRHFRYIMADKQSLSTAIAETTARLNALRIAKEPDQAALDQTKKELGELKKKLGESNKAAAGPSAAADAKKRERLLLKTAKVK